MIKLKNGFTLIELLVVIAVMAVIASAVLVLLDPADKANSANDSRVQADIGQVATALVAYATTHGGFYPTTAQTESVLVTAGDLTKLPTPPSGYSAYTYVLNAGGTSAKVYGQLKSKKYVGATPSTPLWGWCESSVAPGASRLVLGVFVCP